MSVQKGYIAEDLACDYLLRQGLRWRASNYRSRLGEIDLIMQDGTYIIFVEVRARSSAYYGAALETVTTTKQRKIIKAATYYLQSYALLEQYPSRFDVVALQGNPPTIRWIQNAFAMVG